MLIKQESYLLDIITPANLGFWCVVDRKWPEDN